MTTLASIFGLAALHSYSPAGAVGDLYQGVKDLVGEVGQGCVHRAGVPHLHDRLLEKLLHWRLFFRSGIILKFESYEHELQHQDTSLLTVAPEPKVLLK